MKHKKAFEPGHDRKLTNFKMTQILEGIPIRPSFHSPLKWCNLILRSLATWILPNGCKHGSINI